MQSRYYNPEIGRFINADAMASTGQGLLGNNMYAYCQNMPISNIDPNGLCTYVGYAPWMSSDGNYLDCKKSDCPKSKFYIQNKHIRNTAKVLETAVKNLDVEVGIGLGLYIEKDFFDFLSISVGIRYDLINVGFSNGTGYSNQSYFCGIDGTALWVFDFDVHAENQIRENPFAEEIGPWRDDTSNDIWATEGTGAYFFGGARYHIGFDVISFCEDIDLIFQ